MESALNYKDSDIKYVFVRGPESCLELGWTTDCQPTYICLRPYLCVKAYLTFCSKSLSIPSSVVQTFDRHGICIKLQRQWYTICVRTCAGKLFKIWMNNILSAKIFLFQTPFVL